MGYDPNSGSPAQADTVAKVATNSTGSSIAKFIPVKITATGMDLVDPSVEADIDAFAGLTNAAVPDGSPGTVVSSGTVKDTGLAYAAGTVVFMSKTGGVTDTKPAVGVGGFVAGDWVIRLGVVTLNDANPALRDVILMIQIFGRL